MLRLSVLLAFLSYLFLAQGESLAQNGPRYGLWVEVEGKNRPFDDPRGFAEFEEFSGQYGFTDLYCQVYRGGRSWFPSMFADDVPYRTGLSQGFDPLEDTIKIAHARGQRVHAWVNVLRVIDNPRAPIFKRLGRKAALMDSFGNSLLDYDSEGRPPGNLAGSQKLDTQGIWLDPSSPEVRQHLVETIRDLVLRYPRLDGIHMDMIRSPMVLGSAKKGKGSGKLTLGFSPEAGAAFFKTVGKPFPGKSWADKVRQAPLSLQWKQWRRSQITLLVFEIRELLNEIAPHMELSAAVFAWPDRAFGGALQDWPSWLAGGALDTVIPMSYTKDTNLVWAHSLYAVKAAPRQNVMVGLGAWLMVGDEKALTDTASLALRAGADGVTLFSYSNLLSSRGRSLLENFEDSVLASFKQAYKY